MTTTNDARGAEVTLAMRDYLGAIDRLGDGQIPVTTQRIAEHLGVSSPSVTNMVKRLHVRGLVTHAPYHGVRLTDTGLAIAASARHRRRLLERYLVRKLGYAAEGARIEAIRLERAVDDSLESHMEAALNRAGASGSGTPGFTTVVSPVDRSFITDDQHLG